jgi:hypothetical protein
MYDCSLDQNMTSEAIQAGALLHETGPVLPPQVYRGGGGTVIM